MESDEFIRRHSSIHPSIINESYKYSFKYKNALFITIATNNIELLLLEAQKSSCITPRQIFPARTRKTEIYTVRTRMKTNITFLLQLFSTPCNFDGNSRDSRTQKARISYDSPDQQQTARSHIRSAKTYPAHFDARFGFFCLLDAVFARMAAT